MDEYTPIVSSALIPINEDRLEPDEPLSAHVAYILAGAANRAMTQDEPWHSLQWCSDTACDASPYNPKGQLMLARVGGWSRITPTFTQKKLAGVTTASYRCLINAKYKCYLSITTLEHPIPGDIYTTFTPTTPGTAETRVLSGNINVSDSSEEQITYWLRGAPTSVHQSACGLGATLSSGYAEYLCANGGLITCSPSVPLFYTDDASLSSYAQAGTYVAMLSGTTYSTATMLANGYMDVIGVPNSNDIVVYPACDISPKPGAQYLHFFKTQYVGIYSLAMAGDARTV